MPETPSSSSQTPSAAAGSSPKKQLKTALAWALGLGLLAWLLHHVPFEDALAALARPSVWTWSLTLAGLLGSYALRSARLQVVLDLDHHRRAPHRWLGLRTDALRVILMHNAAVNLLPMRAGELSFPWLASRELNYPVSRAIACLMWMRLQDLSVLCLLGVLLWPGLPLAWRGAALLAMALGWWSLSRLLRWWFERHPTQDGAPPPAGWRGHLLRLREALLEPAHHRPAAWLLTLSNWALKLAAGAGLLSAISGAPWLHAWAGALGGELAAIVPLQGPAGFGTYEAGVWAGMAASLPTGASALQQAIAAALALHVCFLVCAVFAGLLALVLSRLQPRPGALG
ncbi:MAG: flippase-like domain-containing protein [Burkholderiales bacterium]|nr:flippase-like domain-containing protein [Burkholderiales bacterium]